MKEVNGKDNKARGVDEGGRWDGGNGDNGYGQRTKKQVDGQRNRKTEKKHKGEHKKEDSKGRGGVRVLYWNVAGLSRTGEEFWEYIRKFEIVGMVETWIEE
jgi:hypothetical protein